MHPSSHLAEVTASALARSSRLNRVLKACLQEPTQVASVCPSSNTLVQRIATCCCSNGVRRVIEIGPGVGETTEAILNELPPDAKLLAIEKTESFIESLEQLRDNRLLVRHGDAADLTRFMDEFCFERPDVIVSGVPFSSLEPEVAKKVICSIYHALPIGGRFVAYQLRSHVIRYAKLCFGKPDKVEWVLRNLPPLRIIQWTKNS